MLQVARECSGRDPGDLLSYGECCLVGGELQRCYRKEVPRPSVLSRSVSDIPSPQQSARRSDHRTMSKSTTPNYEVFLGGSCNPTTWRQDEAIPFFKKKGISFYNPQVSHWEEALVYQEYQAKQNASVLFFVFDPLTRNVASMVESGYLAGSRRKLIVVINQYSGPGHLISGEPISKIEYDELSGGLSMLQDLVERQEVPVFSQINHALTCTVKMLCDKSRLQELCDSDKVRMIKYPYFPTREKLLKVYEAFANSNSHTITLAEARVFFKVVCGRDLTHEELEAIVAAKKGVSRQEINGSELPLSDIHLSFEDFCLTVAEFENQPLESRNLWDQFTRSISAPFHKAFDMMSRKPNHSAAASPERDVFLGGSQGPKVSWREDTAIPILHKHGLSFYAPSSTSISSGGSRLLPTEANHIESSRVLLLVITSTTRAVAQMALAAYYIGLQCNVVLCVQNLEEGCTIQGEQLSRLALKDYNRGRSYLVDQANKEGVPVFSSIEEAVECIVQRCKTR